MNQIETRVIDYNSLPKLRDSKNRRILFLDFDGVINNDSVRGTDISSIMEYRSDNIGRVCIDNITNLQKLVSFCYVNDIYICIVSAWNIAGFERVYNMMFEILGALYVRKCFIGATRYSHDIPEPVRSGEIDEWVNKYEENDNFVILDDSMDFHDEHKKIWVRTTPEEGLTMEKVNEVISMFKCKEPDFKWIEF